MNNLSARRFVPVKFLLVAVFVGFYSLTIFRQGFADYASVSAQTSVTPEKTPRRFDAIVRGDFFAGMMGNRARLERGMKYCEDILAKNPKHPDALVWHGGGLLTMAADAYRKGDAALGDELWDRGLKEMNEAVALAPDDIAILIGRAATVIGLAQSGWDPADKDARALVESVLLDYEKVYRKQKPYFHRLDEHSRGELLFGLASGWSILGEHEKARLYLDLIIREVEGTQYEKEAKKWLDANPRAVIQHDCRGCHAPRY
jgi:hypothetical protein